MTTRKSDPVPPSQARVQVGPLIGIPALLSELGGDCKDLFRMVGLASSAFDAPENKIPYLTASRILAKSVEQTGCEMFGFLVGQRVSPSALGLPGFMLRAAPNVCSALALLTDHIGLHDEGGAVSIASNDGITRFSYRMHHPGNPAADQVYDLSIAVACNVMRALCGPDWAPIAVRLSRRHCPDPIAYRRFFHSPLELGAPFPSLLFDSKWLDQEIATADEFLLTHLTREANSQHGVAIDGMKNRLQRLLPGALGDGDLTETHVAAQLGVPVRTLHRQLQAEGTNFREEVRQLRYCLAQKLLADPKTPLTEIAATLGYADLTVFSRAFRSWAGVSASQWRRNHGK